MQLKLQAELDGLGLLQAESGLIFQQFNNQKIAAEAQLKQLNLRQGLDELKQRAALANALPPGKRQQAQRKLQEEIFNEYGQSGSSNFYNAAIAQARGVENKEFGTSTRPDILGAINPNLGGILDEVGGRAAAAIADTVQSFNQQFGNTKNITGALTTGIAKSPLQLPGDVQQIKALSDQILKGANQPDSSKDRLEKELVQSKAQQSQMFAVIAKTQSDIAGEPDSKKKATLEASLQAQTSKLYALVEGDKQRISDLKAMWGPGEKLVAQNASDSSIRLPSPTERGAILSLENSGMLFKAAIDKLVDYLKEQNSTIRKGSNYNIKIDAPQKTTATSGNGNEASLENVLNLAKQMAGAY